MEGAVLLHRKVLESFIFANEKDLKIWVWLLLKARYKNGYVPLKIGKGEKTILLKRGQLIFGRHKAEEALKMDGATIARHLNKMKAEKMILIDVSSQYSVITICKYDSYQKIYDNSEQPMNKKMSSQKEDTINSASVSYEMEKEYSEQPMSNQRAGNEQPMSTNNKDNKDNKEGITHTGQILENSNLYRKPNIPELETVTRVFSQQGGTEEMSKSFFNTMTGVGWYYKSSPVTDFTFLVPKYIEAWNKNLIKEKNGNTTSDVKGKKLTRHEAGRASVLADIRKDAGME